MSACSRELPYLSHTLIPSTVSCFRSVTEFTKSSPLPPDCSSWSENWRCVSRESRAARPPRDLRRLLSRVTTLRVLRASRYVDVSSSMSVQDGDVYVRSAPHAERAFARAHATEAGPQGGPSEVAICLRAVPPPRWETWAPSGRQKGGSEPWGGADGGDRAVARARYALLTQSAQVPDYCREE